MNKYKGSKFSKQVILAGALMAGSAITAIDVYAQENTQSVKESFLLEEVIVTARKREENIQDVPLSISAFGEHQLEALKVRNLESLSVGLPNVALDDIGSVTRGTANFSIRGLGINSSIPSLDPTVGVFIDGVYLGVNQGVLFDTFDLESIEVLRGPQGILFGRNVTGGAVLVNTKKPSLEGAEGKVRVAFDRGSKGGLNSYLMANFGGPINERLAMSLSLYYNDDEGPFENGFDGKTVGAIDQKMFRPVVLWQPNDAVELIVRYEQLDSKGDGTIAQSHITRAGVPGTPVNSDRDSFDFSIDEVGFQETNSKRLSVELNWDIGENGVITNIIGWRDLSAEGLFDTDSQPLNIFHTFSDLTAEQFSEELRYSTLLNDNLNLNTGIYYFTNDVAYSEQRNLLSLLTPDGSPYLTLSGGGNQKVETMALFFSVDYSFSEKWSLSLGGRYTEEEKEVEIASMSRNTNNLCNVVDNTCPIDYEDKRSWPSFSPKIGATYHVSDDARIYAYWAKGYRSGGYNLRNTAPPTAAGPEPFDEETVNTIEIGFKSEFDRGRLNAAFFYNRVENMQREVTIPDSASGNIQLIRNTAEVDMLGLELDGVFSLTENLILTGSIGLIDAEYDKVLFDLNNDSVVDGEDYKLALPRLADLTYSVGLNYDFNIGSWAAASRASYSFRDEAAFTDSNVGYLNELKIVNAGIDFYSADKRWSIGLYGNNLLDEVKHGADFPVPNNVGPIPVGGSFSSLTKGRHYGVELTYSF